MGGYDKRDPHPVARQVTKQLLRHWSKKPPDKPLLVLTQGDPPEPSGIAAITPLVALHLGVQRVSFILMSTFQTITARMQTVTGS